MRRPGRRWLALGITLALLLGACSRGDDNDDRPSVGRHTTETDAAAVDGGRLVVGLASTPDSFDPTSSALSVDGLTAALAVFDPLMAYDAAGDVVPYLAETLEHDDENVTWTLTLREGVTFSNGEPLTSAAVVRSFDAHLASELTRQSLRRVESVGAVNDRVVAFRMTRPWASFPSMLTGRLGLVPAPSMLDAGAGDPIGTGPFVVQEWLPGASVRLTRNPSYWRRDEGLPHLDELELRAVPDAGDRVAQLASGDIDVVSTAEPDGVAALEAVDDVATARLDEGAIASYPLVFNTAAPPFDDLACRRAVAGAIDHDAIAEAVAPDLLVVPDDADAADDGANCDFTFRTGVSALDTQVAELLRDQLDGDGIAMTIEQSDASSVTLDALLGRFEAIGLLDDDLADPDERLAALDGANASPIGTLARNVGRFDDADVQELLDATRATTDAGERAELELKVDAAVADRLPYVTLFRVPWMFGFKPTVGGIRVGLTLPGGGTAAPRPGVLLAAELHTTATP